MTPKLIKTHHEYTQALARIDKLLDYAPAGTPQADELELLSLLVEHYEKPKPCMELPLALEQCVAVRAIITPELVYELYPRKQKRAAALKAIAKALEHYDPKFVLEKTAAYAKATDLWPEDAKQFIPHATTWFNQEQFLDDPKWWERAASRETVLKELKQKEEALQKHPGNPNWVGYNRSTASEADRTAFKQAQERLRDLRRQL